MVIVSRICARGRAGFSLVRQSDIPRGADGSSLARLARSRSATAARAALMDGGRWAQG
jgi:hypothetical protein